MVVALTSGQRKPPQLLKRMPRSADFVTPLLCTSPLLTWRNTLTTCSSHHCATSSKRRTSTAPHCKSFRSTVLSGSRSSCLAPTSVDPQGYRLACLFTNIATAGLILYLRGNCNVRARIYAYLNDSVYITHIARELERAITSSKRCDDDYCGCTCNLGKSSSACTKSPMYTTPLLVRMSFSAG